MIKDNVNCANYDVLVEVEEIYKQVMLPSNRELVCRVLPFKDKKTLNDIHDECCIANPNEFLKRVIKKELLSHNCNILGEENKGSGFSITYTTSSTKGVVEINFIANTSDVNEFKFRCIMKEYEKERERGRSVNCEFGE